MSEYKTKVLIVDDEPQIRRFLNVALKAENYDVEEADTAAEALRIAIAKSPQVIILDLGLPDKDGTAIVKELREFSSVPIIVLSVRSGEDDKIKALDLGANDYITKPFSIGELLARIRVCMRNKLVEDGINSTISLGNLTIDLMKHEVKINDKRVKFSKKEYNLLSYLIKNDGKLLTQREILKHVWGEAHVTDSQYLRVYIGQIRQKIEADPANPQYIITEPGVGYRIAERNAA